MKRSVWVVGLLAVLMILPACSKKEEKSKEMPAAQQQGQPASPAATAGQPTPATSTMGSGAMDEGEKIYNQTCKSCHGEGIDGAPKFGDKAAWADRIAEGMDTLENHALNGFTGKSGTMPPKGGNAALSDDDVKAAVEYMVSNSK